MNLESLKSILRSKGCQKIYVKKLAANDNSKNQIYLSKGSWELLNIFPLSEIKEAPSEDGKRERFKASIDFCWIGDNGETYEAPKSQFILYPDYPEIRFSGFLDKCTEGPSDLMSVRLPSRLLFLSVTTTGQTLGFVASPESTLAEEFKNNQTTRLGVFQILDISNVDTRTSLLYELNRINRLNWITSKRLDKFGNQISCNSSNCGGYTLEAELGIIPNSNSEPDFLGWEIKQFGVNNFSKPDSSAITLMTPEPTGGLYVSQGVDYFIHTYGYDDKNNVPDRLNFGGTHKIGIKHKQTGLTMELVGFDSNTGKIKTSSGKIVLLDSNGNEAAEWSFASMLKHWNRKHNNACYVPSMCDKTSTRKYRYGNIVKLGTETDFQFFLQQMSIGNIVYDPAIKMEKVSTHPTVKRRSQFRIKSRYISNLYKKNESVDTSEI